MAGTLTEDYGMSLRPSATDGMLSEQLCQSGDSITEWRSSEQVENGTASTSPPYWDTDDDDGCGLKPSDLYGRFTWKIENFSTINKRELRSNAFEVGSYKWYILIYPQGCDVCNHLSLFLCVANHDKLLPGWSHFAQFTIAVVNKDPKKSKYSDTLHRFWKKEHDWGWKKFMELSKVYDGFIVADTLVIKAQVQVIREKTERPFRCLDRQYRRELVRVYLSNVEQICRRFIEERIGKLSKFIEDKVKWSSFQAFWLGIDTNSRRRMSRDKTDAILKIVVKHFFIEKEVTSTLVMDSLYSGLKALELKSKNLKGKAKVDLEEQGAPIVRVDKDLFVLADDVIPLIERVVSDSLPHQPLPSKDEKCLQNRTKEGSSGDEFNKDSIERDERRLMELGRRTTEIFVLVHIFSSRIEASYQEAIALRRQEELIREEEAAGLAENELKSKRGASEKEKQAKKKQAKQKRNNRKVKDKVKDERANQVLETLQQETHFCSEPVESVIKKIEPLEDVSDVSDTADDVVEVFEPDLDDRDTSPTNWDTDTSEAHLITEASGSDVQNGHTEKKNQYVMDDSSSTCSTDSVPSAFINGPYKGNILPANITVSSPTRGKNNRKRETNDKKGSTYCGHNPPSEITYVDSHSPCVTGSKVSELESEVIISSKNEMQLQKDLIEKEEVASLQNKLTSIDQVHVERESSSSDLEAKQNSVIQSPKPSSLVSTSKSVVNTASNSVEPNSKEVRSVSIAQGDKVLASSRSLPFPVILSTEAQKYNTPANIQCSNQENAMSTPSTVRPIPAPRSTTAIAPTIQMPLLSRSVSSAGRLGTDHPSPSAPNYVPLSYRNATIGKTTYTDNNASSGKYVAHSQSPSTYLSSSCVFSPESPGRKDQTSSGRPGLTFGCIKPELVHNQHLRRNDSPHESSSSIQAFASNVVDNMEKLDIYGKSRKELFTASSITTPYQVQGTMAEFPHIDIINDLLDDEQNVGRTARGPCHTFNRQYSLPGNFSTAEFATVTGQSQFNQSEQYYDEGLRRGYGASSNSLQGLSDGLLDYSSPYASNPGQFDGLIQNRWPCVNHDLSMLRLGNRDATGYSYQLRDYLMRGANGSLYRHANGP